MKAVLDTKAESAYDDDTGIRYHFPSQYLPVISKCIGDWIVYRQPRARGGHMGYFAVARISEIKPDHTLAGHHYAYLNDFLPFDTVVTWRDQGNYAEHALRKLPTPSQVGTYLRGRSVRELNDRDFASIIRRGLRETLEPANAIRLGLDYLSIDEPTSNLLNSVSENFDRRVEQLLLNRKVRDAAFRSNVCMAYEDTCAVTGLKMVNGGGRAEVQAAHIWPVATGGPDTVQNGIALSGTVHWLFDRHLLSIGKDYELLVAHNRVPSDLQSLFENQMHRIRLPLDTRLWPSQEYLERHRESFANA